VKTNWFVYQRVEVHGVSRMAEVCQCGTPAGPDPDRAEMLLAEGLANAADYAGAVGAMSIAFAIVTDRDYSDESWLSALSGAASVLLRGPGRYENGSDPNAYAAGAALAMALEDA
jgi:hypothetical protein